MIKKCYLFDMLGLCNNITFLKHFYISKSGCTFVTSEISDKTSKLWTFGKSKYKVWIYRAQGKI